MSKQNKDYDNITKDIMDLDDMIMEMEFRLGPVKRTYSPPKIKNWCDCIDSHMAMGLEPTRYAISENRLTYQIVSVDEYGMCEYCGQDVYRADSPYGNKRD